MPEQEQEEIWVESQPLDQYIYEKHPLNDQDSEYLESTLGKEYLDAISRSGAKLHSINIEWTSGTIKEMPFKAFYYRFGDTTITLKVSSKDTKTVTIDFLKTVDFQHDFGSDENDNVQREEPDSTKFFHVEDNLSKETLSLLHHLENTMVTIRDDCRLILKPNTKRRERIYTRLANRHPEKSNFTIESVGIDDRKNLNFWL